MSQPLLRFCQDHVTEAQPMEYGEKRPRPSSQSAHPPTLPSATAAVGAVLHPGGSAIPWKQPSSHLEGGCLEQDPPLPHGRIYAPTQAPGGGLGALLRPAL